MTETIPLSVNVCGETQYPPNWMFVWAMAINSIEWAMDIVETSDWQNQVKKWYKEKALYETEQQIAYYEKQLKKLLEEAKNIRTELL